MDAKTAEALEASIAKWKRNAEAKTTFEYKIGGDDCALCLVFCRPPEWSCAGCPVAIKTGEPQCHKTPYYLARSAFYQWVDDDEDNGTAARAAARDEVEFLMSLLPVEVEA